MPDNRFSAVAIVATSVSPGTGSRARGHSASRMVIPLTVSSQQQAAFYYRGVLDRYRI